MFANQKKPNVGVKILKDKIDTSNTMWCNGACLVYVQGTGALKYVYKSYEKQDYNDNYLSQLMLNEKPLVQINSTGCPTCASMLATGYGIDNIGCAELSQIANDVNADYISLDISIKNITPLLGLLESGLYMIADTICYPTDGDENFFWDVSNKMTSVKATAPIWLKDYDYSYVDGFPMFLYPSQSSACFNESRVDYYVKIKSNTESYKQFPRAIVYNFLGNMNIVLDGHHKSAACTLMQKPVSCISIIPCSSCYTEQGSNKEAGVAYIEFASFKFTKDDIPKDYFKIACEKFKNYQKGDISEKSYNILNRKWESYYKDNAKKYPSAEECAKIVLSEICEITDSLIENCFLTYRIMIIG